MLDANQVKDSDEEEADDGEMVDDWKKINVN